MKKKLNRFWEIDTLRGIAIILMVFLHFLFDLNYHNIGYFRVNSYPLIILSEPARLIFIGLVGVSLYLSYERVKNKEKIFYKFLKRGLFIFGLGLCISIFMYFLFNGSLIIFGVLHFIGLSIILAYPFLKLKYENLILGIIILIIGLVLKQFVFSFPYLLIFGFRFKGLSMMDYFPILPWFGIVLIGIFIGKTLYPNYERSFNIFDLSDNFIIKFISYLGRHSLVIYIIHQPILFCIIYLIF